MQEKKTKKQKGKKSAAKGIIVLCFLLVLLIAINIAMNIFSGYVDLFLGGGDVIITKNENSEGWDSDYYTKDYATGDELKKAANDLVEEIEAEGAVLLKNNGALPLKTPAKLTLLGRDAADPVYGGSGSGSVKLDTVVDLRTGIENAGFEINDAVYSLLEEYAVYTMEKGPFGDVRAYTNPKGVIVMDDPKASSYYIGEMPVSGYTEDAIASFSSFADAAIVVIGRGGGEGGDLTRDMNGWDDNYVQGQHQLELNQDEKDLLALAKSKFENVIVLVNASSTMELGVLEDDAEIDAVLWVGSPGQTGFNAVGKLLSGEITPSGRTADIYPADFTKDPTFVNFGNHQYSNISKANAMGDGFFVQYEEGIYVGYRYYETAAQEGFINYDEAVVYPFGYGLSYTSFTWEVAGQKLGEADGTISVDVKVTNTGDTYAGKEVVQLYYSAPYTKGGIEKPAVALGAFAKTGLIAPGASETVSLSFAVEDMASYDYEAEKAYVLEKGDYVLSLRTDSHTVKEGCEPITYNMGKTIIYSEDKHRASDETAVTNQFDDVSAMFKDEAAEGFARNMSRADFAGTFPTAPTDADMVANDAIIKDFAAYKAKEHQDPEAEKPTTGAKNGLNLIDLRGLAHDDPSWQLLLDQLTPDGIKKLLLNGAYTTAALPSVGKPATADYDGPAGISSFMTELSCTAYPSEVVIASTFNTELVYRMGVMVGNEALDNKVSGWYAPGFNMHRSPFAGRNFEYYSEDPYLSGVIGANVVSGAATKGVYTTIKHFAVNDQETNRVNNGVSSWVNEQALREIYLKPFEYAVKNAAQTVKYISDSQGTMTEVELSGTTAVMSSFNRIGGVWAGGSKPLLQNVLRDEWGFEGFVISDFNLYDYMYPDQGLAAGTDLMLTFDSMKTMEDASSPTGLINMRKAAHNILFTVANSNAMNGITPGTIITYTPAPWRNWLLIANIAIGALLCLGFVLVILRAKKNRAK